MFPSPKSSAEEAAALLADCDKLVLQAVDSSDRASFPDEQRFVPPEANEASWRIVREESVYRTSGWYNADGILFTVWEHANGARVVALYDFGHCSCNGTATALDGDSPRFTFGLTQFKEMAKNRLDPRLVGLNDVTPALAASESQLDDDFVYNALYDFCNDGASIL